MIFTEIKNTRAWTLQSLSVHYRYRNQPIRMDTITMLYRYIWKYNFKIYVYTIQQNTKAY